jgi:DNA topoisomerase-1
VLAALVRLLDTTLLRVGNEEYAAATAPTASPPAQPACGRARRGAAAALQGQERRDARGRLDDPRVAKVVRQCQQLPGQALFQYADEEGELRGVSSTDVNDYIADAAQGERFTAKDFRTWHGTVQALELTRLACEPGRTAADGVRYSAKDILAVVARQLGNTPAVCKKAYVHPAVLALGSALTADDDEATTALFEKIAGRNGTARPSRGLYAAERRLLAFLRTHRQAQARERRATHASAGSAKRSTPRGKPQPPAASERRTLSRASTMA